MASRKKLPLASPGQPTEALHASEDRYRDYFELGLVGMAITSPEKGCVEVNDEMCRMVGYGRNELLGMTWAEITHPSDLAADVANFDHVLAGEIDSYVVEKRFIRKDGLVIDAVMSVKCIRHADGAVNYFVALVKDNTARKRIEAALESSHRHLQRQVAERTRQLTAANHELRKEIVEREFAELESKRLKDALAQELAAMTRLHDFSTRLLASTDLAPLMEEVLNATMAIQEADFGMVQLYNPETDVLEIIAHRGFPRDFLDFFASVRDEGAICCRAFQRRQRVIVEDIETDDEFAPYREIAASSGFRAVQSTPLLSRHGEPLGIISTHFRRPHRPSDHQLRMTDLYAVHAAAVLERKQTEMAMIRFQQELQSLTAKLIESQEMDSKYLARELHDAFSQKLAVLGMEMAALAHQSGGVSQEFGIRLLDLTAQIGSLTKDLHGISRRLHPAILDDLGLAAALRNECAAFSEQHGIRAEFDPDDTPWTVPDDISLCLYRVAQECLRNAAKHSRATSVKVALLSNPIEIAMEISDSGDGFDVDSVKGAGGLGLISMEERVRLINGVFSIISQPGAGAVVKVRVPLQPAARKQSGPV